MLRLKATGCIMSKCLNCKIEVLDETERCPLCQSILQQTEALENMYPDVRRKLRWLNLFSRIYLFLSIILEAVLFGINFTTFNGIWWSIITGLVLLYGYVVLRYAILGKSGNQSKAILLILIFILSAFAIDLVTGYRGWSLEYVLPAGILLIDVLILACMFYFNRRNWQSYILWQICMVLCSICPLALYLAGMNANFYMTVLPMAVSVTLFLGTMILGDRRARTELKRRFHY